MYNYLSVSHIITMYNLLCELGVLTEELCTFVNSV